MNLQNCSKQLRTNPLFHLLILILNRNVILSRENFKDTRYILKNLLIICSMLCTSYYILEMTKGLNDCFTQLCTAWWWTSEVRNMQELTYYNIDNNCNELYTSVGVHCDNWIIMHKLKTGEKSSEVGDLALAARSTKRWRVLLVGVKVFNILPSYIKIESYNPNKLTLIFQKFWYENSFYSFDEYFELQKN